MPNQALPHASSTGPDALATNIQTHFSLARCLPLSTHQNLVLFYSGVSFSLTPDVLPDLPLELRRDSLITLVTRDMILQISSTRLPA